jgi:hypothetical protein
MTGSYDILQDAVRSDADREASVRAGEPVARSLAAKLPMVHRTALVALPTVLDARKRTMRSGAWEKQELAVFGQAIPAYLFLGTGAYPDTPLGILLRVDAIGEEFWYTPFDTGGVLGGVIVSKRSSITGSPEDDLRGFLGEAAGLQQFVTLYLPAHFRDPLDYVRRPQEAQPPDFPPFHRYESATGDRRAWTIELQARESVPVTRETVVALVGMGKFDRDRYLGWPYSSAEVRATEKDPVYVAVQRRILELVES